VTLPTDRARSGRFLSTDLPSQRWVLLLQFLLSFTPPMEVVEMNLVNPNGSGCGPSPDSSSLTTDPGVNRLTLFEGESALFAGPA
jgi:hypothetical protein